MESDAPDEGCLYVRRLMNHNAVIMALHILADDDGLVCKAKNAEIADVANRSIQVTLQHMRDLEMDGVIKWFGSGHTPSRRFCVLMTHPRAKAYAREVRRQEDRVKMVSERQGNKQA